MAGELSNFPIRRLLSIFIYDNYNKEEAYTFLLIGEQEGNMDKKDLKKLLASLTIVSLVAGAGLSVSGCASA
jgi:radical SAM modification target selenobiotic family peptide